MYKKCLRGYGDKTVVVTDKVKKDEAIYGLEKIPNDAIIKQLRIELGQANSFIQEQQHIINKLKSQIKNNSLNCEDFYDVDKLIDIPEDLRYNKLKLNMSNQIKSLEKKIEKLKQSLYKQNYDLHNRII